MAYEYFDNLPAEGRKRYMDKIDAIKLKECPYRLPKGVWSRELSGWPDIQYPDIYEYLTNTPGVYTREAMKSRKGLEAYNQFQSGWVQEILMYKSCSTVTILTAKVMHSQRLNEDPLQPWMAAKNDGTVICAHCNCMAGMGESCSHIGALLFKVEAAVRLGYTSVACTSKPCQWNNDFITHVEGEKIKDIQFHKSLLAADTKTSVPYCSTECEQVELLSKLQSLPAKGQPVALSLFNKYSSAFHHKAPVPFIPKLPKTLRENFSESLIDVNLQVEKVYEEKLTEDDLKFVERSTIGQSHSLTWKQVRIGRITASVAYDVLHTSQEKPSKSLILKICTESRSIQTPALTWGITNEPKALEVYEKHLKKIHANFKIKKCGIRLHSEYNFLGASADGIGKCDCHGEFLIEIKCPYKHKEAVSIEECVEDQNFCLDDKFNLKKDHRYMIQVQMQLYVYAVDICHFVIWTPNFFHANKIVCDETFSEKVGVLVSFHKKFIAKELVTREIELGEGEACRKKNEPNKPLFCICQTPETGDQEMIGCDNPACKYKWFHFTCIKMKRPPKNDWYCQQCKTAGKKRKAKE